MAIDLVSAIKAPTKAQSWVKKIIGGGILLCIPIVNFIVFGYLIEYLSNVIHGRDELPDYSDLGCLFTTGFKMTIGSFLLSIPLVILTFIIGMFFDNNITSNLIAMQTIGLLYGLLSFIMIANFALDKKITSMIDFKRAFLLLKNNVGGFIVALIYMIVAGIGFYLVMFVSMLLIVGFILIPFLTYAISIILYNILGQFAKNAPHLEDMKALV